MMLPYSSDDYVANTRGRGQVSVLAIAGSLPAHVTFPEAGRRILARTGQVFLVCADPDVACSTFRSLADAMTGHGTPVTMVIDVPGRTSETFQIRETDHQLALAA